jgi:putative flippase GtrA
MSSRLRVLLFVAVGGVAAAVHWFIAVLFVRTAGWVPLAANAGGWAVALCVSFAGQSTLTFGDQGAPFWRSARRYALLSLGGFLANETAYAVLLQWTSWRYDLVLAVVLCGVAVATFMCSRLWAFRPA